MPRPCGKGWVVIACDVCRRRYAVPYSCNRRSCPRCGPRVAWAWARLAEAFAGGAQWPAFLTLTRRWRRDVTLAAYLKDTWRCFYALRRLKVFRSCVGGLAVAKLQHGEMGVRVHVHAVLDARWIPWKEMVAAWRRLTDGDFIVRVERLKRRGGDARRAGRYVAKYMAKAFEVGIERARLVVRWGSARDVKAPGLLCPCCLQSEWLWCGSRSSRPEDAPRLVTTRAPPPEFRQESA